MCIVFSIAGRVCWYSRVTVSSMFVDGSSYVSFPRPFILHIHFVVCFESEMSGLLLGTPGHCSIHHYVHCWCDFTPCLIWVDYYSSLFSSLQHHPRFCFWSITLISPLAILLHLSFYSQSDTSRASFFYTSRYQIIFLHHLIIDITFTLGTFRSMAHELLYTCCISCMRAWVLIIGYLGLVSLHFYHPITLAYVMSRVLRPPWGHGIRCRLRQPLLGQVFEIWSPFRYCHASSSERRLSDG